MQNLFRKLPKVDILMDNPRLLEIKNNLNYSAFYELINDTLTNFRTKIKSGEIKDFEIDDIVNAILEKATTTQNNLKTVINGTGTIIHTNLGRSVIAPNIMKNVEEIATHYNNLEYDIENGTRYNRNLHVEKLICELVGVERDRKSVV